MIASVLKKYYYKDAIIVAITPCTSKKLEIVSGDADYVLTTSELSNMIRETGLVLKMLRMLILIVFRVKFWHLFWYKWWCYAFCFKVFVLF